MLSGQFFVSRQAVGHQDIARVSLRTIGRIVHHGIGASLLEGCFGKTVAVKRSPFQGYEDTAFGAMAAVGGHHLLLPV